MRVSVWPALAHRPGGLRSLDPTPDGETRGSMSDGLFSAQYRDRHGKLCRSKVWSIRVDPITKRPLTTGCRDREAARAFRAERERIAADPHYAASRTETIGKWVREMLKVKLARKSSGTVHMYRVKLGH